MKMKGLFITAPIIALILVLPAWAGCGGNRDSEEDEPTGATTVANGNSGGEDGTDDPEPLSGEDYMGELTIVTESLAERKEEIQEREFDDSAPDDEQLEFLRDLADDFLKLYEEAFNDMEAIAPPPELKEGHDEFVAGLALGREFYTDFREDLGGTASASEARALAGEPFPEGQNPYDQISEACKALKAVAEVELGIESTPACYSIN